MKDEVTFELVDDQKWNFKAMDIQFVNQWQFYILAKTYKYDTALSDFDTIFEIL